MALALASAAGAAGWRASALSILDSRRKVVPAMILLLHPRATNPKNRRFPLAILAIAAVLEGIEEYAIIDGNVDPDPGRTLDRFMSETGANLLAVSVMPGPQIAAAIPLCSEFRPQYPSVPLPWGRHSPSLHPR